MTPASGKLSPMDPSSFSRPELVKVESMHLMLSIDFEAKVLSGHLDLTAKRIDTNAKELILDSKDLDYVRITEKDLQKEVKYTVSDSIAEFGSKLSIELPPKDGNEFVFTIEYSTSPNASGLQWLSTDQTAGKKFPYVFSQFQPIHARSVLPCQDTPAVKTKYSAEITVPRELTVLMSALRSGRQYNGDKATFLFVQNIPIPSYLIALVAGALESKKISPRSTVWAEKEQIVASAKEFEDTESQLQVAEEICGPYLWGTYDLLVLPPSFGYGGMENPCLTFVTPTLLAGDKSLVSVVAHEISHSWTGNLVTNRNFEHFWLNEGFTTFIERKIKGRMQSINEQDFSAINGLASLKEAIEQLGATNPLTKLVVNLDGVHPDDAFSVVPYEKGYIFLRYLENTVGGPSHFEPFLRSYFEKFQYKSIDTNDFKNYFNSHFANTSTIKSIDWDMWLNTPGMPSIIPEYNTTLLGACNEFKNQLIKLDASNISSLDKNSLSISQLIYVLQELIEKPLPVDKLKVIEKLFGFDTTQNAEIKYRWLRIGVKAHWEEKADETFNWLNVVGRMKYVRPLYRDLYAWEQLRERTIENFKKNKKYMMHMVAYTVAQDLHIKM